MQSSQSSEETFGFFNGSYTIGRFKEQESYDWTLRIVPQ